MSGGAGRSRWLGISCGAFVVGCGLVYRAAAAPAGLHGARYIMAHLALTAAAGISWWLARRLDNDAARIIIWAGIAARLILVPVSHFTTHDPDRYLWDGAVAAAGFDPYVTAPDDAAVIHLRRQWATPAEHGQYATLYPPAALAVFAACSMVGPSAGPWAWKSFLTCASLLLLLMVARDLYERDDLGDVAWVALNPLLILEGGVGAHVDMLAACGLTAAVLLVSRRRLTGAGLCLGIGILFKLTPAAALLPLAVVALTARDRARWRAAATLVGSTVVTVGAGYGFALALGMTPVGVIGRFFDLWRFGSPLVAGFEALLGSWLLPAAATAGTLGIGVVAGRGALLQGSLGRRAGWAATAALMVLFACSPVVFPWYLVPVAALLALAPSWTAGIWITTLPLTYEVIDGFDRSGAWQPSTWPLWAIAAGWLVGSGLDRLVPLRREVDRSGCGAPGGRGLVGRESKEN